MMVPIKRTLEEMAREGIEPRVGITITRCRPGETAVGCLEVEEVRPWYEAGVLVGWYFFGWG